VARYSLAEALAQADALIAYAKTLTETAVSHIPDGRYTFTDYLDDDGQRAAHPSRSSVTITVDGR
jgi:N-methylhydantoinase B